jgi:hypothetical protein
MTMMATPLRSVPGPVEGQTDPLDEDPSFERFFDAERTRLFGALAVMSGNRAEAEEVMQGCLLEGLGTLGSRVREWSRLRDSSIGPR